MNLHKYILYPNFPYLASSAIQTSYAILYITEKENGKPAFRIELISNLQSETSRPVLT
jgi:hypothetical protein